MAVVGYPDVDTLIAVLQPLGYISSPITGDQEIALTAALSGAIRSWESGTGFRPFWSDGTVSSRFFNGPRSHILQLDNGLISLTYLKILTTPYIVNQGFFLGGPNAAADREPYTYIDFGGGVGQGVDSAFLSSSSGLGFIGNSLRAIEISGVWGYTLDMSTTYDAYEAILEEACRRASKTLTRDQATALSVAEPAGALTSVQQDSVKYSFGGGGKGAGGVRSQDLFTLWQSDFREQMEGYRILRIG